MENIVTERNEVYLAERSQRFYAFFIDSIFSFSIAFLVPLIFSIFSINSSKMLSVISLIIVISIQGNLLIRSGQTIGKRLISIRIIDSNTLKIPNIKNVFIIRYLLIWQIPNLLSSIIISDENFLLTSENQSISTIEGIVSLIALIVLAQTLLIFRSDRRCGHDILSGTRVEKLNIPIFGS